MSQIYQINKAALVTGTIYIMLSSVTVNATTEFRLPSLDNKRLLVACPLERKIYQGVSSDVGLGFAERDLILLDINDTGVNIILRYLWNAHSFPISKIKADQIRQKADCQSNDKYVLIGKDGGVKRRWTRQYTIDELFQTIDAMPMRQFEMRTRGVN